MAAFYEPSWETGKAVRWRIKAPAAQSMGAAAIWDRWKRSDGSEELSFSLLTNSVSCFIVGGGLYYYGLCLERSERRRSQQSDYRAKSSPVGRHDRRSTRDN